MVLVEKEELVTGVEDVVIHNNMSKYRKLPGIGGEKRKEYREVPGSSPNKFLGGLLGGKAGKLLNPAAAIGEKLGAGPDTLVGKMLNPLSMLKRK